MSRVTAITLAALIALAPASTATAQVVLRGDVVAGLSLSAIGGLQERGRGNRDRGGPEGQRDRPRMMSEAQAQSIAQSRAGGARFVGSLGLRGTTYVFRFERDGRIIDIAVDARG